MTSGCFLYLSRGDVEQLGLTMAEIVPALEAAFRDKALGHVEMPPKPGIHSRPHSFINAMPVYNRATDTVGLKWVSGYPANPARGLPYITGLIILNHPETGLPIAVMDATWVTAMRTGAATAVAARYLAKADSASLAVLGCGVQGHANTEALKTVFASLAEVRAYDTLPAAAARFAEACQSQYGLRCRICASPREAVEGADMVVTAGPIQRPPSPVLVPEWLAADAFVSAVDVDAYVTPAALHAADIFATDDLPQYAAYHRNGRFPALPTSPVDLGDLVAGKAAGRRPETRLTMALNLGLALEDLVTAHLLYGRAVAGGVGVSLTL